MASSRLPAVPQIDPDDAPASLDVISSYLGQLRLAVDDRAQAIEALGFNPSSPFWEGRSLPSTTGACGQVTGLLVFGLYDAIALVWNFDPDQAIIGWEITRDSVVIDAATSVGYIDRPGDLAGHSYTVAAIRADATRGVASAAVAGAATTSEATARANYAAAVAALQTAWTQQNAFTASNQVSAGDAQSTTSTTFVDMPSMTLTITTVGRPVVVSFGTYPTDMTNGTGAVAGVEATIRLLRDGSPSLDLPFRVVLPAGENAKIPLTASFTDTPAAGSHTYKMQYKIDNAANTHAVAVRGIQASELIR